MESDKPKSEGAIWDNEGSLSVKIGEETYKVEKVEDKKSEKYPDWKSDKIAVWDRVSAKGNEYRFVKVDDTEYVAFKNDYKKTDKHPDWIIKKSKPRE
jgi:uncharacterized protein (DUF736 family)